MTRSTLLVAALLATVSGGTAIAQANKVSGSDARLADIFSLQSNGRIGSYPNGINGLSAGVTVCNVGSVTLPWRAPMNAEHPVYSTVLLREVDGKFEQISDRSWVKHGFASINANFCGTCRTSNGQELGPNCSDTYGSGLNADRYYLGPPSEIDPWLGTWEPVGSHFDRGQPDVGAPQNRDGRRSLTRSQSSAMDPVEHRVVVADQDLLTPGANYYYQMYIVVAGEPEGVRDNNMIVRQVQPVWNGSSWRFNEVGGQTNGTVLRMWSGARLNSSTNLSDDGRVYVASRVTGPDERGLWRYEFAIHNRDNSRGVSSFRLPICANASVFDASFRDIDADPANDWQMTMQGGELAFVGNAANALEWNMVFNIGFTTNAAPVTGSMTVDQARAGGGAPSFTIGTDVPGLVFSPITGMGCGNPAPTLWPTGSPAIPTIPNATFGFRIEDLAPNASGALVFSFAPGNTSVGNCSILLDFASSASWGGFQANSAGVALAPQLIPTDPSLEGGSIWWQAIELQSGGELGGVADLSNGLRTRIGNSTTGCQ